MKNYTAMLLLMGLLLSMTSCGTDSEPQDKPNESTAVQTETVPTEPETVSVYADLPVRDFGGMVFNMLHYLEGGMVQTLHAEEMTGEPINDVLFTHSASVEEALNINIELNSTDLDSVNRIVKESTASGDNTYQAFWQHLGNSVNLAFEGNCYPLSDLESFDFEKPWWKQSLNQDISVGENVFLAFGDITLYTYESMTVMTFNKGLLKDFQKEDPYDLVDRNEWTFDAFRIMLEDVKQDVNGNGVYGEELQDIFALGGYPSMSFEAFFINQGMYLVTKDENNIPHFNGMSEEHYDFFMQMSDLISDKERVSYMKNFTMNFAGNKQLFFAGPIFYVNRDFRDSDVDYGLVPYPKADDEQAEYYGTITTQIQPVSIPTANPDPEGTAIILENLAAESHRQVRDVYYNTLLEYRYVRDEKSIEMLDLIYNSDFRIGLESIFNWSNIVMIMNDTMRAGGDNIISKLEGVTAAIQTQIDTLVSSLNSK